MFGMFSSNLNFNKKVYFDNRIHKLQDCVQKLWLKTWYVVLKNYNFLYVSKFLLWL